MVDPVDPAKLPANRLKRNPKWLAGRWGVRDPNHRPTHDSTVDGEYPDVLPSRLRQDRLSARSGIGSQKDSMERPGVPLCLSDTVQEVSGSLRLDGEVRAVRKAPYKVWMDCRVLKLD